MAYKALTYINLPFVEIRKAPGETITKQELKDAQQTDDDVKALLDAGSISEDMDAEIHPENIIPDPTVPTIQLAVSQAQAAVAELEDSGSPVPKELRAMADLDYSHVISGDKGTSNERTS